MPKPKMHTFFVAYSLYLASIVEAQLLQRAPSGAEAVVGELLICGVSSPRARARHIGDLMLT